MTERRGLPSFRAVSILVKTLDRELTRAGFDRVEKLGVVNGLLGLLLEPEQRGAPASGVADAETDLANRDVFVDALNFELRRVSDGNPGLLLVVLDVVPPDWCTDEAAWALHRRIAELLKGGVRPADTVGRLSTTRYGVILPGAAPEAATVIVDRLLRPLHAPRRAADQAPEGTTVTARLLFEAAGDAPAEVVLARCADQEPIAFRTPAAEVAPVAPIANARSAARAQRSIHPAPGHVLALGGGAARATAHIGVLRALVRSGFPIVGIAGTNVGAVVAAMFLCGMSPDEIHERFSAFVTSDMYRAMRRAYATYRRARPRRSRRSRLRHTSAELAGDVERTPLDDDALTAFIEFMVGSDRDISSLALPYAAAATDLAGGRPVWMASGPLHHALRGSCAVPGLFPPQRDGDRILVDGMVVCEVPVNAAAQLGGGAPVLAVHLARPERPLGAAPTTAELLMHSNAMMHKELVREQLRPAKALLTAHVEEVGWLDFGRVDEIAAIGEAAAVTFLSRFAAGS